ncbi:MAG: NAD-dependent epimerase/dehydratase family protein [Planctomycetes bacterium]|nr:NAD-dependent epimerase/dehydratase family protein [Planctomycetota bacterium]
MIRNALHRGAVLVTGASGYVGSLIVAKLLCESPDVVVLPVRPGRDPESVRRRIATEMTVAGRPATKSDLGRLVITSLPPEPDIGGLLEFARDYRVREIIHCAGSADYLDARKLTAGNVELTRRFVEMGKRLGVSRFVLVSTAFSSGCRDGLIRETLHEDPGPDPTPYTRTKREAEWIVAESGLPYLIVRPSIVVGDSRDGHYRGPQFGLYQLWQAAERFLCAEYLPRIHSIAPKRALPLVHQNALQDGFLAAYRHLTDGAVVHLVSRDDTLPTVRETHDLWIEQCLRPQDVHYYETPSDVPMDRVSPQERCFIEFANVNLRISAYRWRFETAALDRLRADGLEYPDATRETVAICQSRFMRDSDRVQRFMRDFGAERHAAAVRRHEVAEGGTQVVRRKS